MAGMASRMRDWRKVPRTPIPPLPDNDATRLLAYLRRGGYVIVPREPTSGMLLASDIRPHSYGLMIGAWEKELAAMRRAGAIGFVEFVNGKENVSADRV